MKKHVINAGTGAAGPVEMTPDEEQAFRAARAKYARRPDPMTVRAFKNRLTADERAAIRRAAMQDEAVFAALDELNGLQGVRVDDPDVVAFVDLIVEKGLLTQVRRDEILAR